LQDLKFAVSLKRPHGGTGVTKLCDYIIDRVIKFNPSIDYAGNIHVDNRKDDKHTTLFTAHVDTVHKNDGVNEFVISGNMMHAKGDCLGADDAAGVAILLNLLDNDIPAYYIFFQGEERGGVGSSWLAENRYRFLHDFSIAVAFDRKATHSIITEQMSGRTASDVFAEALASELNSLDDSFMFIPDDTGIYTDTAEFEHIIPECTNISVGYYNEHTQSEKLDLDHFKKLAKVVIHVKWDELPAMRNPREPDIKSKSYSPSKINMEPYFDSYYNDIYGAKYDNLDPVGDPYNSALSISMEEELLYAVEDAIEGRKKDLIEIVVEHICGPDSSTVLHYASPDRLTRAILDDAKKRLEDGDHAEAVMEYLFSKAV
jgi:hypothetical protein